MRLLLTGLFAASLLAGCAVSAPQPVESERYEVRYEGDRVVYRGPMSEQAIEDVAGLLSTHGDSIDWLEIESPGGNVDWGLDLGDLVLEHQLNVKVINSGCHSSCANYVFTAGRHRVIGEGALVTWHGSALQRRWGLATRLRRMFNPVIRGKFRQWQERQAAFFDRIEVDARITIVGQDLNCGCIWALSADDMRRFGIDSVDVPESYSETDISENFETSYVPYVRFLKLPDDVFDRIRSSEGT